jgi:hypothetical protein
MMFEPFLTPCPLMKNMSPYMHSFSSTALLTIVHLGRLSQDEQKFAQWFKQCVCKPIFLKKLTQRKKRSAFSVHLTKKVILSTPPRKCDMHAINITRSTTNCSGTLGISLPSPQHIPAVIQSTQSQLLNCKSEKHDEASIIDLKTMNFYLTRQSGRKHEYT